MCPEAAIRVETRSDCNTEDRSNLFPKLNVETVHWIDLFVDFMLRNRPCILKPSATKNWKSRKTWVSIDENCNGTPNFDHFTQRYGNLMVPVADEENCERLCIQLSDYMKYAKSGNGRSGLKYLKDWHFQKDSGTSYDLYELPSVLSFDWINNEKWSDTANPFGDYRFVYFGVKDTWTILHSDVMSSYSWSANICGRKLWYFVPIKNEFYFQTGRDSFVHDIRTMPDKWENAEVVSFVQEPGEIVFVPSNWYHQVHNLEDAISINHNFINASNIDILFGMVCDRLGDVRREIEDVREVFTETEFETQCQVILKADIRVNFQMLLALVDLVIEDRQQKVDQCWICFKHRNVFECKKDEDCMKHIIEQVKDRCDCRASDCGTFCENCTRFMCMYELTCALQCRKMIFSCLKS